MITFECGLNSDMSFHEKGHVRYITFDSLADERVIHAAFTRHGGVSPKPWDSLNFGSTVGDKLENVAENRQHAYECLDLEYHQTFDVWQVHGIGIAIANAPRALDEKHQRADIIITNKPGVVLLMRFADCVPILLFDPLRGVVGIAHAGWQGTVKGVASVAVEALHDTYQSNPQNLLTVIGPSIGPDHYHIGLDVENQVRNAFGQDASSVLINQNGHTTLDLWMANRIQLEQAGVKHIETSQICTACNLKDWYSHRGQHGKTGRFGVVITMRD